MKKWLFVGAAALPGALQAQQRPDIIFIVADDLGWGDVGYHGSRIATPNIDRLAATGIEMDRFYTAPVSSPTRAGLLTGRYPDRFGIRETVIPPWRDYGLDETEQTIADVLGANGYPNRAMLGKWHLGHTRMAHYPLSRGFTYFYGHLNGAIDYFTHTRNGELDWHRDWETCYDKGYSTDLITGEAVKCVERFAREGAYFLYVAYNAPHSPYQVPRDQIAKIVPLDRFEKLSKKEQEAITYQAMVARLDQGVGDILDAVERSGRKDNTIILFMSDNGGVAGVPGGSTNRPLRGNKFLEFDGGVRVPAVLYWEKGFVKGCMCSQVTGYVDMLPTIADIIGVTQAPPRPYDGISVRDVLEGRKKFIERDLYLGAGAAVNAGYKMIFAGRNKRIDLSEDMLVDYKTDPFESRNSIAANPKEAQRLKYFIQAFDTITSPIEELPYDYGKDGFVAPKEWKVTKP